MMKPLAGASISDLANPAVPGTPNNWWVYIIQSVDGSLYTGVSTDPDRRFVEHRQDPRGAKYFNGRVPEAIVYRQAGHTRSSASREEARIKRLSRKQKLQLINKDRSE